LRAPDGPEQPNRPRRGRPTGPARERKQLPRRPLYRTVGGTNERHSEGTTCSPSAAQRWRVTRADVTAASCGSLIDCRAARLSPRSCVVPRRELAPAPSSIKPWRLRQR
jgi:hypothetical protein